MRRHTHCAEWSIVARYRPTTASTSGTGTMIALSLAVRKLVPVTPR